MALYGLAAVCVRNFNNAILQMRDTAKQPGTAQKKGAARTPEGDSLTQSPAPGETWPRGGPRAPDAQSGPEAHATTLTHMEKTLASPAARAGDVAGGASIPFVAFLPYPDSAKRKRPAQGGPQG